MSTDTILLCCRSCHGTLRYSRPADRTLWFCERCGWQCLNGSERLDHLAYGRNVSESSGERNRFYPDQWGR